MPSPLLNLDELALLRNWLNGVPVDALVDYCGDKNPFTVVAGLRSRLLLKARRLDKGWGDAWLAKPPAAKALPTALQRLETLQQAPDIEPDISQPLAYWLVDDWLEKLRPLTVVTVADWLRHYQSCEGGVGGKPYPDWAA